MSLYNPLLSVSLVSSSLQKVVVLSQLHRTTGGAGAGVSAAVLKAIIVRPLWLWMLCCSYVILSSLSGDRGGLDPSSRLRTSPARLIHQKITAFVVQTRHHVAPLSTPHDTHVHTGGSGSCRPSDLSLPAGTAGRLSGDGPLGLTAVPVQSHHLTRPGDQQTFSEHVVVEQQQEQDADRRRSQTPQQPHKLHEDRHDPRLQPTSPAPLTAPGPEPEAGGKPSPGKTQPHELNSTNPQRCPKTTTISPKNVSFLLVVTVLCVVGPFQLRLV